MAYAVAAELKARGYTAECVGEVAKDCIYDAARGDQEAARLLDGSVESQEELYRRQSARERRPDGLVQLVVAAPPSILGLAYPPGDADEDRAPRRAALAQHVGVHVVARQAVGRADLLEERQRFILGFDMRQTSDEAALLLLDLGGRPPRYGGVGSHGESVADA